MGRPILQMTLTKLLSPSDIGSSGSVWTSETMMLRREIPQFFEDNNGPYKSSHLSLQRFCSHVHNCLFCFKDSTMEEDVMNVTQNVNCKFKQYEQLRLRWLKIQFFEAQKRWYEDKFSSMPIEIANTSEVVDKVKVITESLDDLLRNIPASTKDEIWAMYTSFLPEVNAAMKSIKDLCLPPVKSDILKLTDAGPCVGCSNLEVKF